MAKQSRWAFPFGVVLAAVCSSALSHAQTPTPSPVPQNPPASQSVAPMSTLTIDEALRLASAQASIYQSALLSERIAAEDVKQAQTAFLPKVSAPLSYIYTSPALGLPP